MNKTTTSNPAERALQSIVTVTPTRGPVISGTVVGPELVLTVAHVLRGGSAIVTAAEQPLNAVLAGRDAFTDLALLRVPGLVAEPVSRGVAPRLGDAVFAVARPQTGPMVTSGVLSGHLTGQGGRRWLMTDARPFPGFSGGALVNEEGGLVGLLNAGVSRGELLGVSSETALEVSGQLAVQGTVARGRLGVSTQRVRLADGAAGLLTVGIEAEGAAARAGLLVGDVLHSWNGEPIRTGDELLSLVLAAAHQTAELGITRGEEALTLSVNVGVQPA